VSSDISFSSSQTSKSFSKIVKVSNLCIKPSRSLLLSQNVNVLKSHNSLVDSIMKAQVFLYYIKPRKKFVLYFMLALYNFLQKWALQNYLVAPVCSQDKLNVLSGQKTTGLIKKKIVFEPILALGCFAGFSCVVGKNMVGLVPNIQTKSINYHPQITFNTQHISKSSNQYQVPKAPRRRHKEAFVHYTSKQIRTVGIYKYQIPCLRDDVG
jgi:hypothetical protein